MPNLPDIALIEQTHSFPGQYMFKVIGEDDHTFAGRVLAAVRAETLAGHEPAMRTRKTTSGRHVSVTVEPVVQDAHEVLAIYARIYALDGLVMVW